MIRPWHYKHFSINPYQIFFVSVIFDSHSGQSFWAGIIQVILFATQLHAT